MVPIEYSSVEPRTMFQKDGKILWPPNNNKPNLEKMILSHFRRNVPVIYSIVVSQVTNDDDTWQCTICTMVVVHIENALEAGYNVCVLI